MDISFKLLKHRHFKWMIPLILATTTITISTIFYGLSQFGLITQHSSSPSKIPQKATKITALGRLEPSTEVIRLSAPLILDRDRIAELLVKEGDWVKKGQVIAILDSRDRLQALLAQAKEQAKVADSRLTQVKAGAKIGEIQAQQATIARLQAEKSTDIEAQKAILARLEAEQGTEIAAQQANIARLQAELSNAEVEYQRHQILFQEGAISASLRDSKHLVLQTAQQQLNEAQANLKRIQASRQQQLNEAHAQLKRIQASREEEIKAARATLNKIAEVRPVDVQAAQAEVDTAIKAAKLAEEDLSQAYVVAPMDGQILKIHTKSGEKISEQGIVDFGQTQQMDVVAEVYQTDISKIRLGEQAIITSSVFPEKMQGTISHIGLQVSRQNVFSNQPGENLDRRVIEVRIKLKSKDSERVKGLTYLQVQVAI